MNTLSIILAIYCILTWILSGWAEFGFYKYMHMRKKKVWLGILIVMTAPILFLYNLIHDICSELYQYALTIREHGGFKGHREWKRQQEIEERRRAAEWQAEKEERERIRRAYLNGEISRNDLPRALNGVDSFEFEEEMGLSVDYSSEVREIVYVENEYCESLNRFFKTHPNLRLYHMYKFVYLPRFSKELADSELLHYLRPELPKEGMERIQQMESSYPLQYLWYPEDAAKIKHGMMFFRGGRDNCGAKYTEGFYCPLEEGSNENVIAQLDAIVKKVHQNFANGGLYCSVERPAKNEGSQDYADEQFRWEVKDDEVAIIINEVRERIKLLREKGLAENLLLKLIKEEPKLSRLVVTKDMRIILPDYHDMEIEMEPINKAVYLLFLRHPEGIVFKHLPDYRKELAEIYQMIKPLGLNERALRSIEDVTNPCLNSINEKCARIRGAFISRFDESLAKHYYVFGFRGEAKKIDLDRSMVVWE